MDGPAFFDLVIIGAGFSGLYAAKTFLENDPDVSLRIFDGNATIGGVWAKENVYPGLRTNNIRSTIDYSDFPMTDDFGIREDGHVPGDALHEYLTAYAAKWDLTKRVAFRSKVTTAEKVEEEFPGYWKLTIESWNDDNANTSTVKARKLIVATGITCEPNKPRLKGDHVFTGPIVHTAALGKEYHRLFKTSNAGTVAVIGAGKSGYDAVYLAALEGKEVEWIIRKTGRGPVWVFPHATNLGPIKAAREFLIRRRILSFFSPFIWGEADGFGWIRNILTGTRFGQFLTTQLFRKLHAATIEECKYRENALRLLEPEQGPFWYGTASGVYSYEPDLYDFIRQGKIRIYREDVSHLSNQAIHLASGKMLGVSSIITATGFAPEPSINFLPKSLHSEFGVPTSPQELTAFQSSNWAYYYGQADRIIAAKFPYLTDAVHSLRNLEHPLPIPPDHLIPPPADNIDRERLVTPWHLYRSIAPPGLTARGDRSLAFLGFVSNVANTPRLEISALWTYAYLTNQLDSIPPPKKVYEDTALLTRFCAYRSPMGHGRQFPDLSFDQLPLFDIFLRDLGLNVWRKGSGRWWNVLWEMFGVHSQEDYKGIGDEWRALRKAKRRAKQD